jgi:hypothetical protein
MLAAAQAAHLAPLADAVDAVRGQPGAGVQGVERALQALALGLRGSHQRARIAVVGAAVREDGLRQCVEKALPAGRAVELKASACSGIKTPATPDQRSS